MKCTRSRGHGRDGSQRRADGWTALASAAVALLLGIEWGCRASPPNTPVQGWNESWGPLVPHKTFPADCALCHLSTRWSDLRADFQFDIDGRNEATRGLRDESQEQTNESKKKSLHGLPPGVT